MAETLKTEEERQEYIKKLNEIAQKRYRDNYHSLCCDKQRIVKTLYLTGDF